MTLRSSALGSSLSTCHLDRNEFSITPPLTRELTVPEFPLEKEVWYHYLQ
ncbi:MAG: hypothetical protein NTV68_06080 [Methanomicrobiales archaeon]|nr:hypothetical protein [Methanomicrobiales archaeon]